MESARGSLVSLGVPVFNGERELSRCLDSLLRQDYPNLEIVISDNGSTDATSQIAERYSRADPRVKYFRAERNRGLVWNFNRVFELSSGKYFAWTSHDDEREPSFVSTCVERLEQHPDAVLCAGAVAVSIEPSNDIVYVAHFDAFAGRTDVVDRYREALRRLPPPAFYGLYRSSAMRKTRLFQPCLGTDMAFLRELILHGPIVAVSKVLLRYRARKTWNTIHDDARVLLGVDRKPWWYLPFMLLFLDQCSRLVHAPISAGVKVRLGAVLVRHQARELARKVLIKTGGAVCPKRYQERLARTICRCWFTNPNVTVNREDVFFQRVCKPQLGWWR
jgi:glycosyltransferase involved in cell wall biosynthesis